MTIATDCWSAAAYWKRSDVAYRPRSTEKRALNSSRGAKFDVVVTDYRMPRMNGVELIQRIRLLDPNARIILLSGFVEPLGLTEQNTGADAVIAKSANEPARLVRTVKRLVNRAVRKPPGAQTARSRISSAC